MAVGIYTLPICDGCQLPWLPVGWTQDSDPRHLREGAKPLRCGKCKSIGWDREFVKQQKVAIDVVQPMELSADPAAEEISAGPVPHEEIAAIEMPAVMGLDGGIHPPRVSYEKRPAWIDSPMAPSEKELEDYRKSFTPKPRTSRCKHRMTDCPICHPKEVA